MKIAQKPIKSYLLILMALTTLFGYAKEPSQSHGEGEKVDTPEEIREYIAHHLKDSHDFHFTHTMSLAHITVFRCQLLYGQVKALRHLCPQLFITTIAVKLL